MARQKRARREAFRRFPFCFEKDSGWREAWAGLADPDAPLTLEVGCGVAETSRGLARLHPDRRFVGVDIKGERLWVGARAVEREGLGNVALLRLDIGRLDEHLAPGQVEELWLTFPDPFRRKGDTRKRLTHATFLRRYAAVLRPDAPLHFKTDCDQLFAWTREHLAALGVEVEAWTDDLHGTTGMLPDEERDLLTRYEARFLAAGRTTKYLRCRLDPAALARDVPAARVTRHLDDYGARASAARA